MLKISFIKLIKLLILSPLLSGIFILYKINTSFINILFKAFTLFCDFDKKSLSILLYMSIIFNLF